MNSSANASQTQAAPDRADARGRRCVPGTAGHRSVCRMDQPDGSRTNPMPGVAGARHTHVLKQLAVVTCAASPAAAKLCWPAGRSPLKANTTPRALLCFRTHPAPASSRRRTFRVCDWRWYLRKLRNGQTLFRAQDFEDLNRYQCRAYCIVSTFVDTKRNEPWNCM